MQNILAPYLQARQEHSTYLVECLAPFNNNDDDLYLLVSPAISKILLQKYPCSLPISNLHLLKEGDDWPDHSSCHRLSTPMLRPMHADVEKHFRPIPPCYEAFSDPGPGETSWVSGGEVLCLS